MFLHFSALEHMHTHFGGKSTKEKSLSGLIFQHQYTKILLTNLNLANN